MAYNLAWGISEVCPDMGKCDSLLSLGKLARKGFRFILDESDPHAVNLAPGARRHGTGEELILFA